MMLATKTLFVVMTICNLLSAENDVQGKKFTYQKKLLDKMIQMEIKMEQMEKEMKASKENIRGIMEDHSVFVENKTAEIELIKGRVYTPIIAFSANTPRDQSLDANQILVWQSTSVNEGNAYNSVTGIFKAPVTGIYFFSVHICNYSNQYVHYSIVLEETDIGKSYKYDKENQDCNSMTAVANVTTGQRVWVKCISASAGNTQIWESYGRSYFVGALMHKQMGKNATHF